jgi:hypothetical protein
MTLPLRLRSLAAVVLTFACSAAPDSERARTPERLLTIVAKRPEASPTPAPAPAPAPSPTPASPPATEPAAPTPAVDAAPQSEPEASAPAAAVIEPQRAEPPANDVRPLTRKELARVKDAMIQASIDAYDGPCPCPYNTMRNGRSCGRRSAYSRPGGESPLCYAHDITDDEAREFAAAQAD